MSTTNVAKSVALRATHITITPRLRNLHERRGILRKLKEFGEIDVFRPLPERDLAQVDKDIILTVFRQRGSALDLLSRAPLQVELKLPESKQTGILGLSLLQPDHETGIDSSEFVEPGKSSNRTIRPESRAFTLDAKSSPFDHPSQISRQRLYWDFPSTSDSFAEEYLRDHVPLQALASPIFHSSADIPSRIIKLKTQKLRHYLPLRQLSKK